MLIYNKAYFDNFYLLRKAKEWAKPGFISNEEYQVISKQYPSPYKAYNIFARIGLFIFTQFILGSGTSMINMKLSGAGFYKYVTFQLFFFGIGFYILAELSVRSFNFFQAGIKGALLYSGVGSISLGIIGIVTNNRFDFDSDFLPIFICIFPFIAFTAIRFSDRLLSLCAFACLIMINALAILKMGAIGKLILPFESMAFSFLIYYIAGKLKGKEELHYWKNCILVIETLSLITLYLSGNYMVVRRLTEALLKTVINPGEDIHLAIFFYAFTIIAPLVYVWIGLKRKDYIFLRTGLILEISGILAIKYYHTFMPAETAMTLGGIVLILIAFAGIKYLKTPKYGITFEIYKRSSRDEALANIANIVASELVTDQLAVPKPDGVEFGGGEGGGGGAGADY